MDRFIFENCIIFIYTYNYAKKRIDLSIEYYIGSRERVKKDVFSNFF